MNYAHGFTACLIQEPLTINSEPNICHNRLYIIQRNSTFPHPIRIYWCYQFRIELHTMEDTRIKDQVLYVNGIQETIEILFICYSFKTSFSHT